MLEGSEAHRKGSAREGRVAEAEATGTGRRLLVEHVTSVRRLVWAGKHQLGNAAWGVSFPSERALPAGGFGSVHTPSPEALCKDAWLLGPKGRRELS